MQVTEAKERTRDRISRRQVDKFADRRAQLAESAQSLFEDSFRADVLEIDRHREEMIHHVVVRYAELASAPAGVPQAVAYAMLDGLFQQALLRHLAGEDGAAAGLERAVPAVLARIVAA
ncbi:hypothetical protein OG738_20450 [Amycolatopsis sp. NBC_01488]|uniref:hypothetical protein n=1 Tax=Amycolatopsis sp. NBC_01488 TaxID=2903563 RepID=UPI002E2BFCBE|nr:hypothetical protein [Amycolatopsis sp. NBC_01488]